MSHCNCLTLHFGSKKRLNTRKILDKYRSFGTESEGLPTRKLFHGLGVGIEGSSGSLSNDEGTNGDKVYF